MCAVVDANTCHEIVGPHTTPAGRQFARWLDRGGVLVVGGRLTREISANLNVDRYLVALGTAGRLRILNEDSIRREVARLTAAGSCVSNDHHVLAVASLGGATLLFSRDQNLRRDYLNRQLTGIRGRVYQGQRNLLRRDTCRRQ